MTLDYWTCQQTYTKDGYLFVHIRQIFVLCLNIRPDNSIIITWIVAREISKVSSHVFPTSSLNLRENTIFFDENNYCLLNKESLLPNKQDPTAQKWRDTIFKNLHFSRYKIYIGNRTGLYSTFNYETSVQGLPFMIDPMKGHYKVECRLLF